MRRRPGGVGDAVGETKMGGGGGEPLPADLVGGDPGLGGYAGAIAGHAGAEGVSAGGGRGSVGAVAVGVSGRAELDGPVDAGAAIGGVGVVAFGKGAGTDELMVARGGREVRSGLAGAALAGGDSAEVAVGEAPAFGPDACVEDADNDIGAIVKVRPEADTGAEFEKLEGAGGVGAVLEEGEDGGVAGDLDGGVGVEGGGEAMEDGVVDVEEGEGEGGSLMNG